MARNEHWLCNGYCQEGQNYVSYFWRRATSISFVSYVDAQRSGSLFSFSISMSLSFFFSF